MGYVYCFRCVLIVMLCLLVFCDYSVNCFVNDLGLLSMSVHLFRVCMG